MSEIFLIFGLILLNGLFSMAEIALVSSRKARLEGQANRGDLKARAALQLASRPDTFLGTVQIGITLVSLLTGLFSGEHLTEDLKHFFEGISALAPYSQGLATTTVVIIITYFTLVIGELVPKRIGLSAPESIAKFVAGPMRIMSWITHPFVWLLNLSSSFLVRLFNLQKNDTQVTEEEIKAIISEGTEHGAIEEAEQEIIERIFHLGDRNITSLMTHRSDIVWLNKDDTVADIRQFDKELIHSIYPVCKKDIDSIIGVVSLKSIFKAGPTQRLEELIIKAMYFPNNNTAYQVLERFKATKIHHAFIVDEYGTVQGLITLNDILEAIVGDIPQEEDDDYEIIKRADGSFLVDAQIPFFDFLSHFEKTELLEEMEKSHDTLAGLILNELEHIPETGETLHWNGFDLEIIDMDGHRIDKILVKPNDEIMDEMEDRQN